MTPDEWTVAIGWALIAVGFVLGMTAWGFKAAEVAQRRREIQAAKRRHPSARTTMSERERRYHSSNQIGR